ncbi:hypothetical protein VYA_43210 (plasmid) [Vibrio alfacsensis]|nr:hypothetical protein VA249_42930 [Vibrio alfacsensis]BCN27129.1 hypothetical protein VYA_43210 [Vibrio alfacsensis]
MSYTQQESMSSDSIYLHCYESKIVYFSLNDLAKSDEQIKTVRLSSHVLPTKYDGQMQLIDSFERFDSINYEHWSDLLEKILASFNLSLPPEPKAAKRRWMARRLDKLEISQLTTRESFTSVEQYQLNIKEQQSELLEQLQQQITNENLKFALNKAILAAQSVFEAREGVLSGKISTRNNKLRTKLVAFRNTQYEKDVRELTHLIKIHGYKLSCV